MVELEHDDDGDVKLTGRKKWLAVPLSML